MALGMSRDRQRVLISTADGHPGPQISFRPEDLMYVFRECTGEVGGLDRIRLYFKQPIGLTGVQTAPGNKDTGLQMLILYYDYSMVGVTDEEMEMLEGMKKRKAEELVEDKSPKKLKVLSGRPSRRAKDQALMSIANPMARGQLDAQGTPEMRMKRSTVSKAVSAYIDAFREVCPGARFSTFTMDSKLSKAIDVTLPRVPQVVEDPLFLLPSDEGGELLLTSRWNPNSFNITIWASEVDFVLIAVENDEEDEEDDDGNAPEIKLEDEIESRNFAKFMRLLPNGTVRPIDLRVPTMVQLVQIRDWLKENNIPYLSTMTSMQAIKKVDLAALCRDKPEEFDVDLESKRIIGGPLDGFQPFEPYLQDSDDDSDDSDDDIVEDDEEDELTVMEAEIDKESTFEEMLKHAKKVAAMGNRDQLVETFTDLPKDEQTEERLEKIFREAGLWGFLADRLGKGDLDDSISDSDSDEDWGSQEQ